MLRKVVRPDQSAVLFKYDALGRRMEKCITKAGSEKVISFAEKKSQAEESKWEDDFIPRAKLTKDGCYSIFTDYLGTPVGAYDEDGNLVWERELDINGKVMPAGKDSYGRTLQDIGEKNFIPFRFQGQYEDEEIGLYYNRFRYYDPETGQYTQQDPIGLAGGNPTLYGYVYNTLGEVDPFGLTWKDILSSGMGHHIFPRSIALKLKIEELANPKAISWYPYDVIDSGQLHQDLHAALRKQNIPTQGSKYVGTLEEFWELAEKAYDGFEQKGYLKIPHTKNSDIYDNLTPKEALKKIKELYENEKLPKRCPS